MRTRAEMSGGKDRTGGRRQKSGADGMGRNMHSEKTDRDSAGRNV